MSASLINVSFSHYNRLRDRKRYSSFISLHETLSLSTEINQHSDFFIRSQTGQAINLNYTQQLWAAFIRLTLSKSIQSKFNFPKHIYSTAFCCTNSALINTKLSTSFEFQSRIYLLFAYYIHKMWDKNQRIFPFNSKIPFARQWFAYSTGKKHCHKTRCAA